MKLLNKLSINIIVLALCFLCAPSLSIAQSPDDNNGNERPKPRPSMSLIAGDSGLDGATRINATLSHLEYDLSEAAFVEIWIYDRKSVVRQLLRSDWQVAGAYGLTINHDALPAGIYFYDIIVNDVLFTRRFIKD